MDENISISVVSPFFNNESVLDKVIEGMAENLKAQFGKNWEFILVDDGSTDNSLALAKRVIRKIGCSRIRLLSLPWNHGRGRALKSGIDAARGEIIVTTEADGSWGKDIVIRLYKAIIADPRLHCVVASVHLPGGKLINVPANRVFLTKTGNWIIKKVFLPEISMNTGMTRAYRREVIQPLMTNENGKEFHLEVLLKLSALNFNIAEIPATITWPEAKKEKKNKQPKSTTNILHTINTHLRFAIIANPVKKFGWLSVVCLLGSILFLGLAILNYMSNKVAIYFGIVSMFLMLFALLLIGFTIVFNQLKESNTAMWSLSYNSIRPPSVAAAEEIIIEKET